MRRSLLCTGAHPGFWTIYILVTRSPGVGSAFPCALCTHSVLSIVEFFAREPVSLWIFCTGQTDVSVRPYKHGPFHQRLYWWCVGLCDLLTSRTLFYTLLVKIVVLRNKRQHRLSRPCSTSRDVPQLGSFFRVHRKSCTSAPRKKFPPQGEFSSIYFITRAVFSRRNVPIQQPVLCYDCRGRLQCTTVWRFISGLSGLSLNVVFFSLSVGQFKFAYWFFQ